MSFMIRVPIILVLLFIVGSLAQGIYYLAKDDTESDKIQLLRALTVRISVSFLLFGLLIVAYLADCIEPVSGTF